MHSLDDLQLALTNLYAQFGRTDWKLGLAINGATIVIGAMVYWYTGFPINFVGFCIAILGLWGIVSWVMGA